MTAPVAAGPVDVAAAFALGLSMGASACALACLPYAGLWVVGRSGGVRTDLVWFSAGRVAAYTLLAAGAATLGGAVAGTLALGLGQALLGAAAVLAGLWLWHDRVPPGAAAPACRARHAGGAGRRWHPFALGAALSLTPCAPLAAVLAHAAQAASTRTGIAVGLSFGLGAVLSPLLLLLPALAGARQRLGRALARHGRLLRRVPAALLILLGAVRLAQAWTGSG
ncbi:MAG TPA: sulfite exporter TauE/SafE family protein [Chromatiales bacterium]|nr:sulfite exporter TauE/SafE family protein [Chromatiales bacterium]